MCLYRAVRKLPHKLFLQPLNLQQVAEILALIKQEQLVRDGPLETSQHQSVSMIQILADSHKIIFTASLRGINHQQELLPNHYAINIVIIVKQNSFQKPINSIVPSKD
jgi:hypothetical protein